VLQINHFNFLNLFNAAKKLSSESYTSQALRLWRLYLQYETFTNAELAIPSTAKGIHSVVLVKVPDQIPRD
jgi:hypothetical protein